ncbi:MAG: 4Fe-4S binding protein [Deltaproteobacteria bacterium]|nr:4Fe-4S binding protein [Deltaproteobacteria bacterium]
MSERLHVKFAGLELRSPIIVSAGPCTRSVRQIRKLAEAGVGSVVTKSTFMEEEYKEVIKPYAPGHFPDCRPKYVKTGEDTYVYLAGFADVPAEVWAESLRELKDTVDIPIIASQIATTLKGHVKMAQLFESAGASALEFDFCCPMPYLDKTELSGIRAALLHPEVIRDVVIAVKEKVNIPVGIKIVYNPVEPDPMYDAIRRSGVDFVHVYYSPAAMSNVDLDTGKPYLPAASGGVTGPMKRLVNYKYVHQTARALGLESPHITASGHAMNWRDCLEYMMYGCTTVQINHAVMARGPSVVSEINQDMEEFLIEKGHESINAIRGMALPHVLGIDAFMDTYGQTKGVIVARVIPDRCIQCGVCEETCPVFAVTLDGKEPVIDQEMCQGCGLCVANCPSEAIELINVDILYKLSQEK